MAIDETINNSENQVQRGLPRIAQSNNYYFHNPNNILFPWDNAIYIGKQTMPIPERRYIGKTMDQQYNYRLIS